MNDNVINVNFPDCRPQALYVSDNEGNDVPLWLVMFEHNEKEMQLEIGAKDASEVIAILESALSASLITQALDIDYESV